MLNRFYLFLFYTCQVTLIKMMPGFRNIKRNTHSYLLTGIFTPW